MDRFPGRRDTTDPHELTQEALRPIKISEHEENQETQLESDDINSINDSEVESQEQLDDMSLESDNTLEYDLPPESEVENPSEFGADIAVSSGGPPPPPDGGDAHELTREALRPIKLSDHEENQETQLESDNLNHQSIDEISNTPENYDNIHDNYDFSTNTVLDPNAINEFLNGEGATLEELGPQYSENPLENMSDAEEDLNAGMPWVKDPDIPDEPVTVESDEVIQAPEGEVLPAGYISDSEREEGYFSMDDTDAELATSLGDSGNDDD